MLTIYRRHTKRCAHRQEGRKYRRCRCPIWVDGSLAGEEVRRTTGLQNWEKAQALVRDWEAENEVKEVETPISVEEAAADFRADLDRRRLARTTISKYALLFRELRDFAKSRGIRYLVELDLPALRAFCGSWTQGNHTALKKLERLRSFLRYGVDSGWIFDNPARKIKNPEIRQRPTMPFSQDEVVGILEACEEYPGHSRRLHAFVLLLRYSGLRIGDAARLRKDHLVDGKLLLYVEKTGVPVYVPLPEVVVEAMHSFPAASETHFFWSGASDRDGVARTWMKYLQRLFKIAAVKEAHAHRFRDTFAVELLLQGVPIERVAVLLGHTSIRVTERHYAPWVQARQEQLEADVQRTWARDPVIFAEAQSYAHHDDALPN